MQNVYINYFDGVQRVSSEDEANPSETSSEEVLRGTDRLRLFGHFLFLLLSAKLEEDNAKRRTE